MAADTPRCETCEGDGYVDIVDDWGGVIGPAPCPDCSDDDPLEAVDHALRARENGTPAANHVRPERDA